jgi:chemotaxis protein methyltransferase CheR
MSATTTISTQAFALLRDFIEAECGIALGPEKAYLVETRLSKIVAKHGCDSFEAFYQLVKREQIPGLREEIIDAMTTNETLWFRDGHPFTILDEVILPALAQNLRANPANKARIWSAASSTGQEAYSIAMTIHEYCRRNPGIRPDQFEIVGTDISSSAIFLAKAARYDGLAISRGMRDDLKNRYFTQEGPVWCLRDEVKRMVTFSKFNLQNPPGSLGRFDCVFLRYVAIYFSESFKRRLLHNVARATNAPGYLMVGAVESLRGVSDIHEPRSHAGGFYYVHKP